MSSMAPPDVRLIATRTFNALKATTKRKSKLLWLCETCEKDFILYKAGKSMQKEIEVVKRK
jgi:hypothetical protein